MATKVKICIKEVSVYEIDPYSHIDQYFWAAQFQLLWQF